MLTKDITEGVTFGGNILWQPNRSGQDILLNGKVIGFLMTIVRGLQPVEEIYSRRIPESEEIKNKYPYFISEDEGYIHAYFDNLEDFMAFYYKEAHSDG